VTTMKKVLIVDDEQIVLNVLERILMKLGYKTEARGSGEEALAAFQEQVFDLVLLDVLMPGMDGLELAKRMRKSKPRQKIVMVSGLGERLTSLQARLAHVEVDSVLPKPFSIDKIRSVLAEALSKKKEDYTPCLEN